MKPKLSDTDSASQHVLIDLFRKATPAEKFARVRSFSQSIMQLARQGISKANPGISKKEIDILFVKQHYGSELAAQLSVYLEKHETL